MPEIIYVINGPNLNLLGTREPDKYGHASLADVEQLSRARASALGYEIEFRQSNQEGDIVDWIQEAGAKKATGIVLNAAGFTTTSVAILDAILAVQIPVVEIHITNIHARDSFRQNSLVSKAAKAVICGFGIDGYALAIEGLAAIAKKKGI